MIKLASRLAQIKPSATLAISSKAKQMQKDGIDVVDLGAGEPDFPTPPAICEAAENAIAGGHTKYTPASGILELRKAVAARFEKDNGINYDPAQIVVSCGAKHSIFNALFALCEAKDEVLIPAPYWLSYPEMVRLTGAKPVILETKEANEFKIDPAELKKAINPKTKLLLLNSPSNPTGVIYRQEELNAIAEIVLEKKILVLSDEIYSAMIFDGEPFATISRANAKIAEQLILVNGVSKTYAMTGWRIGYLAAPKLLSSAIADLQSHTTSNPSSIAQYAALAALNRELPEVGKMNKVFEERRNFVAERLNQCRGISFVEPQGAFYFFINVSKTGKTAHKVAEELLDKAHVAAVPGEPFGSDQHIRISFATSQENLKKALDRMEAYFGQETPASGSKGRGTRKVLAS